MKSPLYEYGLFGEDISLLIAVVLGFFFGLFLERGGLGDPRKLTGVFFFTDFTVPKVMFTAILVAGTGLYLMSDLGILDMNRVGIVPTFLWPQIGGGLIFGIGFVLSGYCPGTSVAGLAEGRIDALITMTGIGAGSFLFAVVYPHIEGFYMSSKMGAATLPGITGLNHWVILGLLYACAGVMFLLLERYERNR